MYRFLKNMALRLLPGDYLKKNSGELRRLFSVLYRGKAVYCPVCDAGYRKFIYLKDQDQLLCPGCGSLQRQRALYTLLKNEFFTEGKTLSILHISPSAALEKKFRSLKNIKYQTSKYGITGGDFSFDLTRIDAPDNSWDIIICLHVLEHIEQDKKAMSELFRVLKPGGSLFIQVPLKEGKTYEDNSIVLPAERKVHFGQEDHVRIYGKADAEQRLGIINRSFSESELLQNRGVITGCELPIWEFTKRLT